ncbi:hypothetical protein FA15DRAFT_710794 [Coprinopsis marcescibilis]|uniref:CCHC-type domain-containing protein n=1 Tax=Coprinopsis marcescibilis TaxID=230819 RepID=A0A5C3KBI6_COPMA|nr:hypothetical protein FA15DRAFT_710794 [Coprinopsis marcescibilis]
MDKDREADAIPSIKDTLKAGQYVYSEKSFERQYDGSGKRCHPWAGSDNSSSDSSLESESDSSSESSESDSDSDASASSSSESEREGWKKKKKGKKVKKRTDKKKRGKEKEREEVVMKRVVVEDLEKKRLDEIEELSARPRGMKVTEPAYAGLYMRLKAMDNSLVNGVRNPWQQEAPYSAYIDSYNIHAAVQSQVQPGRPFSPSYGANQQPWAGHQRTPLYPASGTLTCYFCGETGHIMRNCDMADRYISTGHCKHDCRTNRFIHMDGAPIMAVNGSLKAAIDAKAQDTKGKGQANQAASSSTAISSFCSVKSFATITEVLDEGEKYKMKQEEETEVWGDDEDVGKEFLWGAVSEFEAFAVTRSKVKGVEDAKGAEKVKEKVEKVEKQHQR